MDAMGAWIFDTFLIVGYAVVSVWDWLFLTEWGYVVAIVAAIAVSMAATKAADQEPRRQPPMPSWEEKRLAP